MAVNSPALFRLARDRAFVDALVADTMRQRWPAATPRGWS
jgi:hypothetical protein